MEIWLCVLTLPFVLEAVALLRSVLFRCHCAPGGHPLLA